MTANNAESIERSRVLAHPLFGRAGLLREIGHSRDYTGVSDAWAKSLRPRTLWPFFPHPTIVRDASDFSTLIHDEATQEIVAAMGRSGRPRFAGGSITYLDKQTPFYPYKQAAQHACPGTMVTSISLSPSRMMLTSTRGLLQHRTMHSSLYLTHLNHIVTGDPIRPSVFRQPLSRNPSGTYWASAANPFRCSDMFAIAASNGSILASEHESRWHSTLSRDVQDQIETVAVDWLSSDVVLRGCRRGTVKLWDIRIRAETTEPMIQHRSSVNHVKRVDENVIVVAGLLNELCTYDLRYPKQLEPNVPTQCYDEFPTYRNTSLNHISTGLDVHHNLAAATTDDGRVQLFDVKKGAEVASKIAYPDVNVACVKFVDDQESRHGWKLIVAVEKSIQSWTFEGSDPIEKFDLDDDHESFVTEQRLRLPVGTGATVQQFGAH